jgi:hypothetical protein
MVAVTIENQFIKKYIPEKHIGNNTGILSYLFNNDSYQKCMEKISKVNNDLRRNNSSRKSLASHLIKNYSLSFEEAVKFVNESIKYENEKRWKNASDAEKIIIKAYVPNFLPRHKKEETRKDLKFYAQMFQDI